MNTSITRKRKYFNTNGIQCFGLLSVILLIGCILAIILHHVNSNTSLTSTSLKFVVVVTRHGARAPLETYPNDPYLNITKYWPEGLGGLTKVGKQQMYKLGQTLRNIYNGFLSEHYTPKEFTAQSTMEERTCMSAATLLAGFYPPKTYQVWSPTIDWQPIPVYSTSLDKYNLPIKPHMCPLYWKDLNYSLHSVSFKEDHKELFEILTTHTGTIDSQLHLVYIWDTLACEYWNDLELPEWTQGIYPDKMIEPVTAMFETFSVRTQTMTRLLIGPLLKSIVHQMSDKVNGTLKPDRKMFYHSGHDLTILGLHKALGINDTGIVNPASSLLLELHYNEENKYFVKMLLIKGTKSTPEPIETEIPNCGSPCKFENFLLAVNKYLVSDWDEECKLTT